nr:guanosine monophosphate reductase [Candidatus Omnitrophota bacterium]
MSEIRKVISYNDVLLCPRNSELEHLSDANIRVDCNGFFGVYPVINAPMDRVCSVPLINFLDKFGCPTTIHRWLRTADEQFEFFLNCRIVNSERCFLSVGVLAKWKAWIERLLQLRKETSKHFSFLVDVANGDTKSAIDTVKFIKDRTPSCTIMAGNVATKSGFRRLQEAGASFIRVGIGGGSICSTRLATGFGIPTLTSVMDCASVKDEAAIIADGGIENSGDICKAMAAGADMVMVGKMLSATSLSGGEKVEIDGIKYVKYSGMASKEAVEKLQSKKSAISIEGASGLIPYTGDTEEIMNNIVGNLRSAVAYYAGCRDWKEFRKSVKFLKITQQGWEESKIRAVL